MAASATDLFQEVGLPGSATNLSSPGYTDGDTTITVGSTASMPTATGFTFAIDRTEVVEGEEVRIEGTYCEFVGTVQDGTTISNVSRVFGTAQDYVSGSSTRVYIPVAAERENRLVEGLLAEHTQAGAHNMNRPKVITSIDDTNGNELIKISATASAVNEFTVTNAATGSSPQLSATGSDSNLDFRITPKGTGRVKKGTANIDNYEEIDRDELTSAGDTLSVTISTPKRFMRLRVLIIASGGPTDTTLRFNSDSGANYAAHYSANFGAGTPVGTLTGIPIETGTTLQDRASYSVIEIVDFANVQSAVQGTTTSNIGSNAGQGVDVLELRGKWANTARLTTISISNTGGGDFGIGSLMILEGCD